MQTFTILLIATILLKTAATFTQCMTECPALIAGSSTNTVLNVLWPATNSRVKVTGSLLCVNRIREMDRPARSSFIYRKCEFFKRSHKINSHSAKQCRRMQTAIWFTASLKSGKNCFCSTVQPCGCSVALTAAQESDPTQQHTSAI